MDAFVLIPSDLAKLDSDVRSRSRTPSVVCVAWYQLSEPQLDQLEQADRIFFVASETSMCSTAYQELLFSTFPLVAAEKCRLLKLEDTKIPVGFPMLKALPEGRPA